MSFNQLFFFDFFWGRAVESFKKGVMPDPSSIEGCLFLWDLLDRDACLLILFSWCRTLFPLRGPVTLLRGRIKSCDRLFQKGFKKFGKGFDLLYKANALARHKRAVFDITVNHSAS